jgi:carbamoylphosphate synthase large subunit
LLPYSAFRPMHALASAIRQSAPDHVFPCDERAVRHLHQLHAETRRPDIRDLIEASVGPASTYTVTETRHELLRLANAQGVRVPQSVAVHSAADLHAWRSVQPFPWVLKADGSWAGLGVRIVNSLSEAEAALSEMDRPTSGTLALREMLLERDLFWLKPWLARQRPVMSAQQYIEGRPANCAVACWNGDVLAGIAVEAVITESATGPCTAVRVVDNPEMIDAAARVTRTLGITGFAGFDFMIETATGAPWMIEMNPRNTPICHLAFSQGRDLVDAMASRIAGRPTRPRQPTTSSDTILFFPQIWQDYPGSTLLGKAFHDVPWEEPALVRELMKPEIRDRYWITRWMRRIWLQAKMRKASPGVPVRQNPLTLR